MGGSVFESLAGILWMAAAYLLLPGFFTAAAICTLGAAWMLLLSALGGIGLLETEVTLITGLELTAFFAMVAAVSWLGAWLLDRVCWRGMIFGRNR